MVFMPFVLLNLNKNKQIIFCCSKIQAAAGIQVAENVQLSNSTINIFKER